MGRAQYKLKRDVMKEKGKIEKSGAKRGLWSKIGMGLGGLLAMGLTGGAATPLVAAMMAGGGTLAGGFLGRQLAAKSKGGKIRGGKFFQDERENLISQIDQSIWAGAGKSALGAGMTSLGAGVSVGKGGLKAALPGKGLTIGKDAAGKIGANVAGEGFKMGDIVKRGTETATYSDSLLGRLGKAIDIKGSVIGSKVGESLAKVKAAGELSTMRGWQGQYDAEQSQNLMQFSEAQGPPAPPTEAPIFGGDFDADRYRKVKASEELSKTKYLESLAGSEGALEPLSLRNTSTPMAGVDEDIMGALMEGYNTPTGQGYDPGDEIFRQQNRGAFMDELALEKGLDSRLGRTFGLPSTTRGYDYQSVAKNRQGKLAENLGWHNRLFGGK